MTGNRKAYGEFIRGYRDVARSRNPSAISTADYERSVHAALAVKQLRQIADRKVIGNVERIKHALDAGYLSGCLPTSKTLGYETQRATNALTTINNPWDYSRSVRTGFTFAALARGEEINRYIRYLLEKSRTGDDR